MVATTYQAAANISVAMAAILALRHIDGLREPAFFHQRYATRQRVQLFADHGLEPFGGVYFGGVHLP